MIPEVSGRSGLTIDRGLNVGGFGDPFGTKIPLVLDVVDDVEVEPEEDTGITQFPFMHCSNEEQVDNC